MKKLWVLVCAALLFTACGKAERSETKAVASSGGDSASANSPAKTESPPSADPNAPIKFPFPDFPAVETTAKAGETVLSMSSDQMVKVSSKQPKDVFGYYDNQTMDTPGKETSAVKFRSGVKQVPIGGLEDEPLRAGT